MDMTVGTFCGLSLSIGALVAGITQIIKVTENIPLIDKLPFVRSLLNTIVSGGHTYEKRAFVAILCLILSIVAVKLDTGIWPALTVESVAFAFTTFLNATAGHALFLKKRK